MRGIDNQVDTVELFHQFQAEITEAGIGAIGATCPYLVLVVVGQHDATHTHGFRLVHLAQVSGVSTAPRLGITVSDEGTLALGLAKIFSAVGNFHPVGFIHSRLQPPKGSKLGIGGAGTGV